MIWGHKLAERIGLGGGEDQGANAPVILGKVDVDRATRGMLAGILTSTLDGQGGIGDLQLKYWYRRPNGQTNLFDLLSVKMGHDDETGDDVIEEIYYRDKPLLGGLLPERRGAAQEILLDAIREVALHLREGGSPREISRILTECNVHQIAGEPVSLPGQTRDGTFNFQLADTFNIQARGKLLVQGEDALLDTIVAGEVNSLDDHRRVDEGARSTYRTNRVSGVTYRSDYSHQKTARGTEIATTLEPAFIPEGETALPFRDFLKTIWKRSGGTAANDNSLTLKAMKFLGVDIGNLNADDQIRVLGASYRMTDQIRKRRYPTALDAMHEFNLMRLFRPVEPMQGKDRFSVASYLGNGRREVADGFGAELGACKVATAEWVNENGEVECEKVMLDLGKLLAPKGSDWDVAVADVANVLLDPALKGIFITHRHLDHMGGIIELARLGLLKGKTIYGSPGDLYMLGDQMRPEVGDQSLYPTFVPIEGEGVEHFKRLSVEYCVDGMDHSTPSNIYRVVARRTDKTQDLAEADIIGSYVFYGDARGISKPEFLARGLRRFGVARQDTLLDVDTTNAKRPGRVARENEIEKNLEDLMNCFPKEGLLTAIISTNDRGIKSLYKTANRTHRNITMVGHNVEQTGRKHNIHGVDPEYERKVERDNVNTFLKDDAREETERRAGPLIKQFIEEKDKTLSTILYRIIEKLTLHPVEFRGRNSGKAQSWLLGDLGKLMAIVTGTQGELFSALYRFAEGHSTLDADRPTAYKVKNPSRFVALIDQAAIPGKEEHQARLVRKLLVNRHVKALCVAIEDGFKVYGLDPQQAKSFMRKFSKPGRQFTTGDDGTIIVSGAPIYRSGHGCAGDIAEIVNVANADISHGTHSNDPANQVAFDNDICGKNGRRSVGRQFFDFEHNEVRMGATPAEATTKSLGRENSAMILFRLVREWGKFFGGTLRAKRIINLDGRAGYDERGMFADHVHGTFEDDIAVIDFAKATTRATEALHDESEPDASVMAAPYEFRRYRGPELPKPGVMTPSLRDKLRSIAAARCPGAA